MSEINEMNLESQGGDYHLGWPIGQHSLWGGSYRLEKVTYNPGALGLPAKDEKISYDTMDSKFILVGERGSGFGRFQRWLNEQVHNDGSWQVFSLRNMQDQDEKVFNNLLRGNPGFYILDRTYYGTGKPLFEENIQYLAQLGSALESPLWQGPDFKFICLTYEAEGFSQDILFSSFFDRVHLYRLPMFNWEELEDWLKNTVQIHGDNSNPLEQAKTIHRLLGGQAKLCQVFFNELKSTAPTSVAELDYQIEKIAKNIIKNPPNLVHRWKQTLKDLLDKNPARTRLLKTYIEGYHGKEDVFQDEDTVLYLAGWVGKNVEGKWGIRSACHRELAVQTLRGEL